MNVARFGARDLAELCSLYQTPGEEGRGRGKGDPRGKGRGGVQNEFPTEIETA